MDLNEFFEQLDQRYWVPVPGTFGVVKFYAQHITFSFEVHDSRMQNFTSESMVEESNIYYGWIKDESVRMQILRDIKRFASQRLPA
jgi:hypothetical protein